MYIIVGLGNPSKQYENTRHNIGFDAIDYIAKEYQIEMIENKHKAIAGKGIINGQKVLLLKPLTFMNLSGESVIDAIHFYKEDPSTNLIVLFDDISLVPGKIRIRTKGSAGGHNGIKNIIAHTGTQEFMRVKIGVGEKPKGWDLADYVLGHFSKEERELVDAAICDTKEAVELMITDQVMQAMNLYNGKNLPSDETNKS